jgi:hypothetical protein
MPPADTPVETCDTIQGDHGQEMEPAPTHPDPREASSQRAPAAGQTQLHEPVRTARILAPQGSDSVI